MPDTDMADSRPVRYECTSTGIISNPTRILTSKETAESYASISHSEDLAQRPASSAIVLTHFSFSVCVGVGFLLRNGCDEEAKPFAGRGCVRVAVQDLSARRVPQVGLERLSSVPNMGHDPGVLQHGTLPPPFLRQGSTTSSHTPSHFIGRSQGSWRPSLRLLASASATSRLALGQRSISPL